MPVDFIKERKKQKYLTISFVVIIIVAVFVLWFGYFRKNKPSPGFGQSLPAFHYPEIKIDFNVLDSSFLKESQPFEKPVPFEGDKGRENPFLPYY
ncbi:MAG TPA: hypothetical protein ENL27_02480 [Candidatus Parcubacteria bacterium]|nr:hypothetical protein [Candidatus Parcubacteria bacterium]